MSINNPSKPIRTNTRSAEGQKGGIRSSIRTKITLWGGLCLALVSLILIGYSVITLRQISIDNSTREAAAIAEANAGSVKGNLDSPLIAARTLAYSLSAIKDPGIPISLSRDDVNGMLRKILIENPSFLGTYTLWEPNTFDGLDDRYVRAVAHDDTGRFIPYWVRGDDGIIHTEALTQYEIPGVGDWYILPRSTRQEVTIAPIFRRIQDQDVVIASFIIPIVQNGKFYGIAGVDAPIGFVQQLVNNIDLYDSAANAVLFTDTGTLIAVRQRPELTNQPANLIYADFDTIQPHLKTSFTRLSPDGKYLQIFSPINIGEGGTHWVMGLIIPIQKITAPATTAAIRQVAISTGLIVLALVFLWLLAGQIVRPLRVLTNTATAVAQGDWTVRANIHSKDEAEVLADAFNVMTSQLQTSFSTLEQRVADRTKALETSAEVSRRLTAILDPRQLAREVVNEVQTAFNYYYAQIYLFDGTGENLVLTAGTGEAGAEMMKRGHALPKGRGLVGRAAENNLPVLVSDTSQASDWLPNELLPDTKAEAAIPIAVGDRVLGVLDVQDDVTNDINSDDITLLESLAGQVAISLQNAGSYARAEAALQEAKSLVEYAAEAIAVFDLTTGLFTEANENASKLYGLSYDELMKVGPAQMSPPRQPDGSDSTEKAMELIGIVLEKGSNFFEWNHINAQGDEFPCEIRMVRLPGDRPRVRASVTDITERKHLQELTAMRARQQEAINVITQRIQAATTIEEAMQVAARELGHALGGRQTLVALEPSALGGNSKTIVNEYAVK